MTLGASVLHSIFFALGVLIVLAMAVWVIRALLQVKCGEWMRAAFFAVRQDVRAWRGAEIEDDVSRAVHDKVEQSKVLHFARTCGYMCFAIGVNTLLITVHIATGAPINTTPEQLVVHLVMQLLTLIVLLWPDLVTPKTIDWFYVSILLANSAYVSPFACTPRMMLQNITFLDFAIMVCVTSRRSLAVTVPLNIVYAASSSATIWKHGGLFVPRPLNIAIVHFFLVLLVPVAGFLIETTMRALMQQGIEMETAKELLGAACGLLRSVCDVVVELDASGVIVSPVDDLGTFLLKGPGFALQSHRLTDFLFSEEDKEMLERWLHEDRPSDVSLAEALHTRMKDSDRNLVRVEIFSFKYKHLDGHPRFMVGLREFADGATTSSRTQRAPEVAEVAERADLRELADGAEAGSRAQCAPEVVSHASDSSASDSGSDLDVSRPSSASVADPLPAVMIVDATREGVPVCGLSSGFQMRVGRLAPETQLLKLVSAGKAQDFANWLKMAAEFGSEWPASRVALNLRQGVVKATIEVRREPEGGAPNPKLLQLLVSKIKTTRPYDDSSGRGVRPYTDFRGTPRERTLRVTL